MQSLNGVSKFFFALALSGTVFSTSIHVRAADSASDPITSHIAKRHQHLRDFYRDLHAYPELSGEEKRTASKIAAELRALGLEVLEGIGGHGVVGILRNGEGPTTLVRSDLDALPVPEATNLAYKSRVEGVMHACGHDFHTMALLGAADVMTATKNQWSGTIVFLAQPAEETVKGAKAMIDDGVFKKIPKPNQLLALHTSGKYKKGTIGITSGPAFANVDSIDVVFKGRGTHGSQPEKGIDPFVQTAEFVLKTQTLVGREKPAAEPAVLSVGSIHGGAKHNIIPEEVKLQLTLRTYDAETRKLMKKRIAEVAAGIAKTSNAPAPTVQFVEGIDSTYNDPVLASRIKQVLTSALGTEVVIESEPTMGGEDFGLLGAAAKAPSLMFWVGQRNDREPNVVNHSPRFAPDFDATAPVSIRAMVLGLMDLHKRAGMAATTND